MKNSLRQTTRLFLVMTALLGTAPCYANTLIDNSATGVVTGSVTQEQNSTIDIGSISYLTGDVQNVTVSAIVQGDVVAGPGTHISVGSYKGK